MYLDFVLMLLSGLWSKYHTLCFAIMGAYIFTKSTHTQNITACGKLVKDQYRLTCLFVGSAILGVVFAPVLTGYLQALIPGFDKANQSRLNDGSALIIGYGWSHAFAMLKKKINETINKE